MSLAAVIASVVKRVPTPTYGYYGGYYARHKNDLAGNHPEPIDEMDYAFFEHDMGMSNSLLVLKLEWTNDSKLKYRIYGAAYRRAAIAVFKLEVKLGVEHP